MLCIASLLSCPSIIDKAHAENFIIKPRHLIFSSYDPDIMTCYYSDEVNQIFLEYFRGHQEGEIVYVSPENNSDALKIELGDTGRLEISSHKFFQIRLKVLDGKLMVGIEYRFEDIKNRPTLIYCR